MLRTTSQAKFVSVSINEHNYCIENTAEPRYSLALPRVFMGTTRHSSRTVPDSPRFSMEETMKCMHKAQVIVNATAEPIYVKDISNVIRSIAPSSSVADEEGLTVYNLHVIENPFYASSIVSDDINEYGNYCRRLMERYKVSDDTNDFHHEARLVYENALKYGAKIINEQITSRNNPAGNRDNAESWENFRVKRYLFVTIRFHISVDILRMAKDVYIENLGLLFSQQTMPKVPEHPLINASTSMLHETANSVEAINTMVLFVDRSNNLSERYISIFGNVIELKPIKDYTRSEGVTICISSYGEMKNVFIPLSDIDSCGFIYKTRECAIKGADADKVFQERIKETEQKILEGKHELERLKQENEKLRQEQGKEDLHAKTLYEQMERLHKLKMDELKERMQEVKEQQERTSSILKIGVAVIGAAITIGTIVIRTSAKK